MSLTLRASSWRKEREKRGMQPPSKKPRFEVPQPPATGSTSRRTVLITGASRGLGRALAIEFARCGNVVVACARSVNDLNSLQQELNERYRLAVAEHIAIAVDVSSNTLVENLARTLEEKKCFPDIVGIINQNNPMWEVPVEDFDAIIDTNIGGIANVLRNFIPLMIQRGHGIIVNFSSGWGKSSVPLVAPYCASKWAVEGLTQSVAQECPPGLAVVVLDPGLVDTDMLKTCFGGMTTKYQTPYQCVGKGDAYSLKFIPGDEFFWAPAVAERILSLSAEDNGKSFDVEVPNVEHVQD